MTSGKLHFQSSPAVWPLYAGIFVSRKGGRVKDGDRVPRIEARLDRARIDPAHLDAYAQICGHDRAGVLPIAYPHVLASGLHLAMLSSSSFPLKLLGLVHVRNRIEQLRPLADNETGGLYCFLEGHRDTDRGQEFDLHTQWLAADGSVPWREVSTFLARRARAEAAPRAGAPDASSTPKRVGVQTTSFQAPAGLGRSYGRIAGDLNPIHLTDATAKLFGFKSAIAHGMWSMARCAAQFDAQELAQPCVLEVAFKLPVFLPAWLMFERVSSRPGTAFALYDAQGHKPHLAGTLTRIP